MELEKGTLDGVCDITLFAALVTVYEAIGVVWTGIGHGNWGRRERLVLRGLKGDCDGGDIVSGFLWDGGRGIIGVGELALEGGGLWLVCHREQRDEGVFLGGEEWHVDGRRGGRGGGQGEIGGACGQGRTRRVKNV